MKFTYVVTFKLAGGATVTKNIVSSCEGNAAARAVANFKAVEVTKIRKLK